MACFFYLTSKGRWDITQHGMDDETMGWSGVPLVRRSSVEKQEKQKHCELPRGGNLLHRANREQRCDQTNTEGKSTRASSSPPTPS